MTIFTYYVGVLHVSGMEVWTGLKVGKRGCCWWIILNLVGEGEFWPRNNLAEALAGAVRIDEYE